MISDCDCLIRKGQIEAAATILSKINSKSIPRKFRVELAGLRRRARLVAHGLRLLKPVVYHQRAAATPSEKVEYAMLLDRHGVVGEAIDLLGQVDFGTTPQALFARSAIHFARWEYREALPLLERFSESAPGAYHRLLARVNMAAARLYLGDLDEARRLVEVNLAATLKENHLRLHANCLEMRAQISIRSGHFDAASADLQSALVIFGDSQTDDELYVRKWQAVVEACRTNSIDPLLAIRVQAMKRDSWETVRDVDLQILRVKFDQARFQHLIFGSPASAYRDYVARELRRELNFFSTVLGHGNGPTMDVITGLVHGMPVRIRAGNKTHQLIDILCRDFYAPMRIGALFSQFFPGDRFDVFSSPERIRKIISRARQWLDQNNIPIKIDESKGLYSLRVTGEFGIILPFERTLIETHKAYLQRLRSAWPSTEILPAREIRRILGLSLSSLQRFITWSLTNGALERLGHGSITSYRLVEAREQEAVA